MDLNDLAKSNNPGFGQAQLECFGRSGIFCSSIFVQNKLEVLDKNIKLYNIEM